MNSVNSVAQTPDQSTGPTSSTNPSILQRLGRWLDRDRWPSPEDALSLFTARLTDVGANRVAKAWAEHYWQSDDEQRRKLLAGLAEASAQLTERKELGLRLFRRLYANSDN